MEKETIGKRIKAFRKRRGITQEQLAKSLGYSHKSVVTHIEKGESEMSYEKMLLLIREYAADANELFDVENIDKQLEEYKANKRKNKKVVVYIHGLDGSFREANDYSFLNKEFDVMGLDYQDGKPWELKNKIREEFKKITENYKEIVIIANSIGCFYAYEYLSDFDIKQAFFISPIADMFQIIFNMMMDYHISDKELEDKKEIALDNGQTLSFDFYQQISKNEDNWKVPTDVLYGSQDDLVYIESIASFLENHPQSKLTIKRGAEHYFHTNEEKEFIKEWILSNIK